MGDRELWLFIDFGSTFTKVVAVDPATETVRARVQAPMCSSPNSRSQAIPARAT